EANESTVDLFVRRQLIKAAPVGWQLRLKEADFESVSLLSEKIKVLQLASESDKGNIAKVNRVDETPGQVSPRAPRKVICYGCGLRGHFKKDCRTKCKRCQQSGHIARNCDSKVESATKVNR